MSMRERAWLTNHGHHAFSRAHELVDELGHDEVSSLHLAIGILRGEGVAAGVLYNLGVPLDDLRRELERELPPPQTPRSTIKPRLFSEPLEILDAAGNPILGTTTTAYDYDWTPADEQFIVRASAEARQMGTKFYGSEHLLLAILRDETSIAAKLLMRHGINFDSVRAETLRI